MRWLAFSSLAMVLALALASSQKIVTINGKQLKHPPIETNAQVYVSISDLVAAGATVTRHGERISIDLQPPPARSDLPTGQWVQPSLWSIRVNKIEWQVRQWNVHLSVRKSPAAKATGPGDLMLKAADGSFLAQLGWYKLQWHDKLDAIEPGQQAELVVAFGGSESDGPVGAVLQPSRAQASEARPLVGKGNG